MNYHKKLTLGLVLLLTMSISTTKADEVMVFAAASLTNVMNEIAANYEKATGEKVIFSFGASNTLDQQIKAGAPADLFFSADEAKMDDLEKAGLIAKGTRRDVVRNSLVIIAPSDSSLTLTSATQLADPKFQKIALAQAQGVPSGIYAKEYLEKIGIWDQVAARIIPCQDVRATLAAVETGNVDVGIVYKTDALHSRKVQTLYEVAPQDGPKIVYPAAVVGDSKHAAAAQKFLDYLGSPPARSVFANDGFLISH